MKTRLAHLLALVCTFTATTLAGEGRHFVVGLSPQLPEAERQIVAISLFDFILHRAGRGDRISIYDAQASQPVATLEIPGEALFEQARPRLLRLAAPLAQVKTFLQKGTGSGESGINAPQFLDFAARHLRRGSEPLAIILVGAPSYHDPEMAFDFGAEGAYPSDGFLALPASESPFSTVDKAQQMEGIAIHWAYLSEARWTNDAHRQGVLRFWSLFIRGQAGALASAAADVKTVFQRAANGVKTPAIEATPDAGAKAEMIIPRHQRVGSQESIRPTSAAESPSTVPPRAPNWMRDAVVPLAKGPAPRIARVEAGLSWGDNDPQARSIDLDLYVLAKLGAKEISFRRTRTAEGWLWKDWLESPAVAQGFETVELSGETDLSQLRIAVNFYSGHHSADAVAAVVRIRVNGEVFQIPIKIPTGDGNRGAAGDDRGRDPHWVVIDVQRLVGLGQ